MNVYAFRSGRSIKGVTPQSVGRELERIRAEAGSLTPDTVLEAATDPGSPLHAAFTWDDSEAARQHRLAEARKLIVCVRVLNAPAAESKVAYVSVRTPERGREYVPVAEALSDEEVRARLLADVRQMIESLERRYRRLEGAGEVLDRLRLAAA